MEEFFADAKILYTHTYIYIRIFINTKYDFMILCTLVYFNTPPLPALTALILVS